MSKRSHSLLWFSLALSLGLVLGAWADKPVSARSPQGLEEMVQSLDAKLGSVLENQAAILKQLERIWKYK